MEVKERVGGVAFSWSVGVRGLTQAWYQSSPNTNRVSFQGVFHAP